MTTRAGHLMLFQAMETKTWQGGGVAWGCSSVGTVYAWHAPSPGVQSQDHTFWVCWHTAAMVLLVGRQRQKNQE